jgi:chromosome partitioning protein
VRVPHPWPHEFFGWDWVFRDGLPGNVSVTEEMIEAADFVVIPIRPSTLDLAASSDAIEAAQEIGRPFLVVINGATRAKAGKLVESARGYLMNAKLPISNVAIVTRDAYAASMTIGKVGPTKHGSSCGD